MDREFLWHVHAYQNDYIKQADTKALATTAWVTAMLGLFLKSKLHLIFFKSHLTCHDIDWSMTFQWVLTFISLGLLILSFFAAVWVLAPRLGPGNPPSGNTLIFWSDVAKFDSAGYAEKVVEASDEGLTSNIAYHIHILSDILIKKYRLVKWGIWLAASGTFLGGFVVFIWG